MKKAFAKMKTYFRKENRDERGQGMTEYALLLLVIVALVTVFRTRITEAVSSKLGNVADSITNFQGGDQ